MPEKKPLNLGQAERALREARTRAEKRAARAALYWALRIYTGKVKA